MSPICKQLTREPYRSVAQAATTEEVVAEADSPTPSPTPPATPSPPPLRQENLTDEDQEETERRRPNPFPDPTNDCLPIDHNLPHMLRQVTGHSNLRSVRELRLRVISREMSLQRLALFTPNLREINLDGSCLSSLRDIGCALGNLHVLRVARCGLESLDGILSLGNLRELHASENRIEDIAPCSYLSNIRIIDLRKNSLSDITYLQFLDACPQLQGLTLAECPAASIPGYRNAVRRMLPNLMFLDGTPLTRQPIQGCPGGKSNKSSSDEDDNTGSGSMGTKLQNPPEKKEHLQLPDKPNTSRDRNATSKAVRFSVAEDTESVSTTEAPSLGAIQKRPVSAVSNKRAAKPSSPYSTQRKPRPLSASATENGTRCDSPSALTSGRVVCGNLTAALRNRKKRCEAWAAEPIDSKQQVRDEETTNTTTQASALASGESQKTQKNSISVMKESEEDLLEKSRKWRMQYKMYRDDHSDRWKTEEEEGCDEEPPSNKSVSLKRSSKPSTTCCPHLFAPRTSKEQTTTTSNKRPSLFPPKH